MSIEEEIKEFFPEEKLHDKWKYLKFEEHDPFNPENLVKGILKRTGNRTYGMIYITHVNGAKVPQIIWGTPKIGYPVSKQGKWDRAEKIENIEKIEIYEKFDGTNVLAYPYYDKKGNKFITYKTRRRPFLGDGEYGKFLSFWRELLEMHPNIPKVVEKNDCSISFELYGWKNVVLVIYDTPLACAVLFGIKDGKVISPSGLELLDVPMAPLLKTFDDKLEFTKFKEEYATYRLSLNEKLSVNIEKKIFGGKEIESKVYKGLEGTVWYLIRDGNIQYKAKPDAVLDIHWASNKIPYHSIYVTIINSFEETDEPTVDLIKEMLLEEFQEVDIERRTGTISKTLNEVLFDKKWAKDIFGEYEERKFDINIDKGTCMRFFGKQYPKNLASKIYTTLWREYGVLK